MVTIVCLLYTFGCIHNSSTTTGEAELASAHPPPHLPPCLHPCSIFPLLPQVSQVELTANGRSFSSNGQTGNTNTNALSEDETAAAYLPGSLFGSVTGREDLGIFFAVYDVGVLFPIANDTQMYQDTAASVTTVVGSPVLAATVGPGLNFTGLEEPVRILLRMNEVSAGYV